MYVRRRWGKPSRLTHCGWFYCESGELVNPLPSRTYELDLHIKSKGRGKVSCAGTSSIEIDFDCTRMVGVRNSWSGIRNHLFAGGTVGRLSIFPNASFFRKPTDSSRDHPQPLTIIAWIKHGIKPASEACAYSRCYSCVESGESAFAPGVLF